MNAPVAFLVFARPEQTARVFAEIAKARPSTLLIVADGPRSDRPEDPANCAAVRKIVERVDWPCRVFRNYAASNMGIKDRARSGLDWVFSLVEEAVILEDDCLPHPEFFPFCGEMLRRYRDDERVMMIAGTNYLGAWKRKKQDYHFSYFGTVWGWASWRRAWSLNDVDVKLWANPEIHRRIKDNIIDTERYLERCRLYDECFMRKRADTWDKQWEFACLVHSGLTVVPSVNLIRNIGFGTAAAVHTTELDSPLADMAAGGLEFPLRPSEFVVVDRDYDRHADLSTRQALARPSPMNGREPRK